MFSFFANLFSRHLAIGDRVRLSGGYDMEPRWLNGNSAYAGECIGFVPSENGEAAVIRLDESITLDNQAGQFVALRLRYVGARWTRSETVHIELFDMPPTTLREPKNSGLWVESHATYQVLPS